jgi:hypothetical protein
MKSFFMQFRIQLRFGIVFLVALLFLSSCGPQLSEQRAIELVRLNYKQQNTTEGAGTWLIDSIAINNIEKIGLDSIGTYKVTAYVNGLYKLPVMEDAPQGYTEKFFDTVQFFARKSGKAWMADDWVIVGSRHE